jgi:sterol desaturase/sphingolipid hydroxylase (fatty acid hydroxylase superfamily)
MSHILIHSRQFRHAGLRRWAGGHHIHHHHPDSNFGVTSPFWDVVLGTRYVSRRP